MDWAILPCRGFSASSSLKQGFAHTQTDCVSANRVNRVTKNSDCYHCTDLVRDVLPSIMESVNQQSCLTCDFRPDRIFCDMPADSLKAFDEIKSVANYPRNTILFAEGRPVRGIYMLCDGRAKLSICSDSGKRLTLRIAGPGEVLGLGAALSNTPYEITAELLDTSQVVFVRRKGADEVSAGASGDLHAGSAHAEPGPAWRLRTGPHHRAGSLAATAHFFVPERYLHDR